MSAIFRYHARARNGRAERGAIEAASREDALARLRSRGLTPIALGPQAHRRRASLGDKSAGDLARTLAQMLRSGLSLQHALRFAAEELEGDGAQTAMRLREVVERGEPPSSGFTGLSGGAAHVLRGVFVAGETSGKLAEALEGAAQAFARSAALKGRVLTSLLYPAFVVCAMIATLLAFVVFVAPTIGGAFDGSEERLPESTRSLLAMSAWLRSNGGWTMLVTALLIAAAFSSSIVRAATIVMFDHISLSPLGGGIVNRLHFAGFARLASLGLSAGVPLPNALHSAAQSVRSATLQRRFIRAIDAVRAGQPPSHALLAHAHPPRTFLKLVQVGEETGALSSVLAHAADLLAAEAEQRLERWSALAGPLITVTLGGMVASVILSLFLGLMSLSDAAVGS